MWGHDNAGRNAPAGARVILSSHCLGCCALLHGLFLPLQIAQHLGEIVASPGLFPAGCIAAHPQIIVAVGGRRMIDTIKYDPWPK
jgi:hypothetical protein